MGTIFSKLRFKIICIFCCCIFASQLCSAQIKVLPNSDVIVGTYTEQEPSSKLTVNSETQGFLAPRVSDLQRQLISAPADGLLVYVTDQSVQGFYYFDAIQDAWLKLFAGCVTP